MLFIQNEYRVHSWGDLYQCKWSKITRILAASKEPGWIRDQSGFICSFDLHDLKDLGSVILIRITPKEHSLIYMLIQARKIMDLQL